MNHRFFVVSGYCLLVGTLLLVGTMVLHPAGGSPDHIRRITPLLMGSHALAIGSLPLLGFGCYGLAIRLASPSRLATLALITLFFGLLAGLIAATINGLTLPLFVANQPDTIAEQSQVKLIIRYGFLINKPMSYILMTCVTVSVGIWSALLLRRNDLPRWLGYGGVGLVGLGLLGVVLGYDFHGVGGFRLFVFALAGWLAGGGVLLIRTRPADPATPAIVQ
ncbi:hypothetical protein [Larkinella sp. C7]|uniref:hypothetical protein n=1 Tax=Larkinella sp. C7 TaxID=2576607 RepID=UPI0011110328|nr:hypothetical protein [Larkinella sp. C7]